MNFARTATSVAALAVLLTLTGCGSDDDAGATDTSSPSQGASATPPAGGGFDEAQIEEIRGLAFDLAFLISVFTHMRPADVQNYLSEIYNRLRPGGVVFASFFLINDDALSLMQADKSQFKFLKEDGGYYVSNRNVHEGALAYDEQRVSQMFRENGFINDKVIYGNWAGRRRAQIGQDVFVCAKPS